MPFKASSTCIRKRRDFGGAGGDGTPYDGLIGEAPPEKGIFSMLQVYERVVVSLVEVCKRVGKSVIAVCEKGQKGLTDLF